MKPQNWNDMLSVVILIGVPVLWVLGDLSETVLGATIATFLLVTQYYFRRKPPEE